MDKNLVFFALPCLAGLTVFMFLFFKKENRKKRYVKYVYERIPRTKEHIPKFTTYDSALTWCLSMLEKHGKNYPAIMFPPSRRYRRGYRPAHRLLRCLIKNGYIANNLLKDEEIPYPGKDKASKLSVVK